MSTQNASSGGLNADGYGMARVEKPIRCFECGGLCPLGYLRVRGPSNPFFGGYSDRTPHDAGCLQDACQGITCSIEGTPSPGDPTAVDRDEKLGRLPGTLMASASISIGDCRVRIQLAQTRTLFPFSARCIAHYPAGGTAGSL